MIHGILQFTLSIAFRYVLHRNKSRDIRCRESFPRTTEKSATKLNRGGGHPPTTNVRPRGKRRKNAREKEKQRCLTPSRGEARTEDNLPPAPRPRKKGGNVWDSDREGLGWPPRELALLLALPRQQPTTIPPFLRRARDRKEENRVENKAQTKHKPPKPRAFGKRGELKGTTIEKDEGGHPGSSRCVSSFRNTNPQQSHLFSVKLGATRKKGREQQERKEYINRGYRLTRGGGFKQRTSFPNPVPSKKRGELQGTTIEKD
jgi:hypothetical protein